MTRLHVISDVLNGLAFDLSADRITIGRAADNTICLEHISVSKHHATLTIAGADFTLSDLDSTNGTIVNGDNIASAHLQDGDRIILGEVELRFALNETSALASSGTPAAAYRDKEPTLRLKPAAPSTPIAIARPVPPVLKERSPHAAERDLVNPQPVPAAGNTRRKVAGAPFSACLAAIGVLLLTIGYTGQNDAMKFLGLASLLTGLLSLFFFFRFGSLIAPRKKRI